MPRRHEDTRGLKNSKFLPTCHPFTANHKCQLKKSGASLSRNTPFFSLSLQGLRCFPEPKGLTFARPQSPSFSSSRSSSARFFRWETKTQTCIDEFQEETRGYWNSVLKKQYIYCCSISRTESDKSRFDQSMVET